MSVHSNGIGVDLKSFLPHEAQRWERLRDQMLYQQYDLQKYMKTVKGDQLPTWSREDVAFTSYLLDCLEGDLAHGDEVKPVQEEDTTDEDVQPLGVFHNEAGRWSTLRDRMQDLPYFDRYVYNNPTWSQDELFSSCLLDRLEEQLENSNSPDINNRWRQDAVIDEVNDGTGENMVEEEVEEEYLEDEDEEEDIVGLGEDDSDSDFDPEADGFSDDSSVGGDRLSSSDSDEDVLASIKDQDVLTSIEDKDVLASVQDKDVDNNEVKKPKRTAYQCKICDEQLQLHEDVLPHYIVHHQEQNSGDNKTIPKSHLPLVKDVATTLMKCKDCEKFVEKLAEHRRENHCNCPVCGKKLASPSKLRRHLARHYGIEPSKTLLCQHCGKLYSNRITLLRHITAHLGIRNEKCDVCDKSFFNKNKLIIHKKIHLPEKPFECNVCGRRFTQRYNMFKHTRIHTGIKPYSCDLCDESFNHNISLKNHKKKKHGIDWWNKNVLSVVTLPGSSQQSNCKPKTEPKAKPEPKSKPKPKPKSKPKSKPKAKPKSKPKPEPESKPKPELKHQTRSKSKPLKSK